MKLYDRRQHRNVERQVHYGIGQSCQTACGLVLFSRQVMVSIHSDWGGALITSDMSHITCRRCLRINDLRLKKLLAIEAIYPGVFDHPTLCGKDWILTHALEITRDIFNNQALEVNIAGRKVNISVTTKPKDRREILKDLIRNTKSVPSTEPSLK